MRTIDALKLTTAVNIFPQALRTSIKHAMISFHSAVKEKDSQLESSIDSWQSSHHEEAEKVKKDLETGELRLA